jgi:hypothetical protein
MSQQRLVVLYVGDAETEQWLSSCVEPYEGNVYRADALLQVLGMYISYMPDVVVLDARMAPDLARKVYFHLRTIDAEPILILDVCSEDWDYPDQARIRVLTTFGKNDVLAEISDLTGILFSIGEGAYHE